jgi:hypothetical protein
VRINPFNTPFVLVNKQGEVCEIDCPDMEYIHNALSLYADHQAGLTQAASRESDPNDPVIGPLDRAIKEAGYEEIDLMPMFSAQYVDTKQLRARLVTFVGEDLTEGGC